MKTRISSRIMFLYLVMVIFSTCIVSTVSNAKESKKYFMIAKIPAPSLAGNLLEEPAIQNSYVYLPPSYYDSKSRYPVVYFLHGFNEDPSEIFNFKDSLDTFMKEKKLKEYIVVGVNGTNKLRGSFYVNSPVTGNWEDYLVKDVIKYVDTNFRTITNPSARGIAGFSMGGFASLNLALKHPDVFATVFSLCPGLFNEKGLENAMDTWNSTFKTAYGAAFSPDLQKPYPFAGILNLNGAEEDQAIKMKWENGFGNLPDKIKDYLAKNIPLKALRIDYGTRDAYKWIPEGCVYFSKLLTENNIPHDLLGFDGGHVIDVKVLEKDMFPFFSQNLEFGK